MVILGRLNNPQITCFSSSGEVGIDNILSVLLHQWQFVRAFSFPALSLSAVCPYTCPYSTRHIRVQPLITKFTRHQIVSLLLPLIARYLAPLSGFSAAPLSWREACFYTLSLIGGGELYLSDCYWCWENSTHAFFLLLWYVLLGNLPTNNRGCSYGNK